MEKTKVLLLEGGKRPSHQTRDELGVKGIQATPVQDLAACLATLETDNNQVVILDLDLQRAGIEAVQKIHSAFPDVAVLVMASLERLQVVDEALRQGAWDFVIKQPDLSHLQELPQALSRNQERKRLAAEADRLRGEAESLRAETERYREEIKKLQAETKRLQEEADHLRSALERGDGGPTEKAADEVLADIAEDLKSPLAAMIGYLEIASTINPERAEPNQILSIQRTTSLARRLFDLVMSHTGALDIEAGKFELQKSPFEINQILELAVQDKQGEATAKNIDLALETAKDLPALSVDPVQLGRAVGILISNAINLSPLGSSVAVSSRLDGDRIAIAVRDSGAGIFKEEIPLLFDRKKKLRRRGADVSTVGLFVAQHVVSRHGGRIDVQSDPVEGTTLTISLPIY
jgi:signal transduction histidine kinase